MRILTAGLVLVMAAAAAATAQADPAGEALPGAPGRLTFGVGPVAELVPGSTIGALGTAGIEVDVGERRSNVYLGVAGEVSYIYGYPNLGGESFSRGVPSARARAGVDVRYALFSWQGYTDCFGNEHLPGSFWAGLRAGGENVDGTLGAFGDVSLGFEHWYIRGGVSVDRPGTYGEQILMGRPVAGVPGHLTPYLGTGIRLLF